MRERARLAVPQVVVPIERLDRATLRALAYARAISSDATALVLAADGDAERLRRHLRERGDGVAVAIRPPGALAAYLDEREREDPERPITVVVSDVVPRRRWSNPLHAEALRLKVRLFFRPNTVVVDVPFHL
jgi:hypothetical protein